VQALLSSHGLALSTKTQPTASSQLSVVQTLLSLQIVGSREWHVPPLQLSPVVQGFPSSHGLVLFVKAQTPVAGLQLSVVQALPSVQTIAVPGLHRPPLHVSPMVQASPSLHGLVLWLKTQLPVTGLQLSVVQGSLSSQGDCVPGLHAPPPQVSPTVQALPSSHDAVLFVNVQPDAGSHPSVVQSFPSVQVRGAPGWHVPALHTSPRVHALPSSHGPVTLA
jgi:hypothetical protein